MGDHKGSSTAFRRTSKVSKRFTTYYPLSHPYRVHYHNIEDCSRFDTSSAKVGKHTHVLVVVHCLEVQKVHVLKSPMLSSQIHEIFCNCMSADDSLHFFTINKAKSDWTVGDSLLLFLRKMPIGSELLPFRMRQLLLLLGLLRHFLHLCVFALTRLFTCESGLRIHHRLEHGLREKKT